MPSILIFIVILQWRPLQLFPACLRWDEMRWSVISVIGVNLLERQANCDGGRYFIFFQVLTFQTKCQELHFRGTKFSHELSLVSIILQLSKSFQGNILKTDPASLMHQNRLFYDLICFICFIRGEASTLSVIVLMFMMVVI